MKNIIAKFFGFKKETEKQNISEPQTLQESVVKRIIVPLTPEQETEKFLSTLPTLEQCKEKFLSNWQENIKKFGELFPELKKSIDYFDGTISGSAAYSWRGILEKESQDIDIFFTDREKYENFLVSLKNSPYYSTTKKVPVKWELQPGKDYRGRVCHRTVAIQCARTEENFSIDCRFGNSIWETIHLDVNLVEEISSPDALLEGHEKVMKYFYGQPAAESHHIWPKKITEIFSTDFDNGVWKKKNNIESISNIACAFYNREQAIEWLASYKGEGKVYFPFSQRVQSL